jgi:hypothetical protein
MTYNTIFLRYGSAEHQANAILSFKTEKHYETKEQAKVSFAKSIVKAWRTDTKDWDERSRASIHGIAFSDYGSFERYIGNILGDDPSCDCLCSGQEIEWKAGQCEEENLSKCFFFKHTQGLRHSEMDNPVFQLFMFLYELGV